MTIYSSTQPSLEFPRISVTEYVLGKAERLADKAAFIEGGSGRVVTYATLAQQIRAFAGGVAARGVGPGTTWAIMAPNLPEYAVVFHGLAYCGATVTTLNPTYGAEEIAFQLKDSKATAIVTIGLFLDVAKAAAKEAGIEEIFVIGEGDATNFTTLFGAPLAAQVEVDLDEHVVVLPYSSGTTGFPKGVMLTHANLVANLEQTRAHFQLSEDEVAFAVLPFFHIYGMQILMNYMVSAGATVVTAPRFDLVQMLELTQTHKITRLYLVPPIVLALAKHPVVDKYDLSSVKEIFSGAAPLSGELADAAAKRLGCQTGQGYGMTELSPVTHAIAPGEYRPSSVGTLIPNTKMRLVDAENGKDVAEGEAGEVWIAGPQVMKGYLNNEEATGATIDGDGWLHTGDVGKVDADGHLYIVDRLKELIKYKGFQVAPAELEAVLINHPGVADVAVIGVPDDEAGELPKAFIVRAPDSQVGEDELKALIADKLAKYKRLEQVAFIDAIPKSASGKILRRELRKPS
ncbi:MAG: AMP-binding protein [Myxococcota bacterium]